MSDGSILQTHLMRFGVNLPVARGQESEQEGTDKAKTREKKKLRRMRELWIRSVLSLGDDHNHSVATECSE